MQAGKMQANTLKPELAQVWKQVEALPDLTPHAGEDALADCVMSVLQLLQTALPSYHWVGVYWLNGDTLDLGPYAGKYTDHTQIPVGVGVCGTAVKENRNLIIEDVREVSNYLACSLETRAEIVVLIQHPDNPDVVLGQLDLDSDDVGAFDAQDEAFLTQVAHWIGRQWFRSQQPAA